jgi:hypothetical protein
MIPKKKGFRPILFSSATADDDTLSPALATVTGFRISIDPLAILVAMFRAWKNEV